MRLGMVDVRRLEQRRANPRAMSPAEYKALQESVGRFGFKSFVVTEEIAPGRYGVVDGHHRWKVALEKGMERIPIVLLDEHTEKAWADLAMLSFNVSGNPVEETYVDLLAELTRELGADVTAGMTALDPSFLENFQADLDRAFDTGQQSGNGEDGTSGSAKQEGLWQGRPIVVEIPRTEEAQQLLDSVKARTGESVLGQAVLRALREWMKSQTIAQDKSEESE